MKVIRGCFPIWQGRNIEIRGAILGPSGAGFFNYVSLWGWTCQVMHSGYVRVRRAFFRRHSRSGRSAVLISSNFSKQRQILNLGMYRIVILPDNRIPDIQSVNFGRHLTEILYPFEISYQIFIHTVPYQYLSFRNFTLPKFSFEKSYLTKIFFSEMLRNFTIIKVSVNRLYVNVTLRKLR